MNVMRQTACLVVNPITVNNFAYLFDCKPTDLMMALASSFQLSWLGPDDLSLVGPNGVQLLERLLQRLRVGLLMSTRLVSSQ